MANYKELLRIVAAIARNASFVSGGLVEGALVGSLIRVVLGVQPQDAGMLSQVNHKLDLLLQGPYRTGQRALADALRTPNASDRERMLGFALERFLDAAGQADDLQFEALCEFNAAGCWVALGSIDSAYGPLRRAKDACVVRLDERMVEVIEEGKATRRWFFPVTKSKRTLSLSEFRSGGFFSDDISSLVLFSHALSAIQWLLDDPDGMWYGRDRPLGIQYTLPSPYDLWTFDWPMPDFIRSLERGENS